MYQAKDISAQMKHVPKLELPGRLIPQLVNLKYHGVNFKLSFSISDKKCQKIFLTYSNKSELTLWFAVSSDYVLRGTVSLFTLILRL